MWPYLLGVYPIDSTTQERADILMQHTQAYSDLMFGWKTAELTHREIQRLEFCSGESSPALSSVSASPDNSPQHNHNGVQSDEATPSPNGASEATPSPNGTNEATPTPNGAKETTPIPVEQGDPLIIERSNGVSLKDVCGHVENGLSSDYVMSHDQPPISCDFLRPSSQLDAKGSSFIQELYNIDKDIPRCDRDYWYVMYSQPLLYL